MGALIRKLVKVAPPADADLHHRARRRPVERRHRRRLPDPHPARRGRLPQRRAPSAGRPRRRLRRRRAPASRVNILITPLDGLLTEITNEAIALVDPDESIDLTANLWFSIASTFFVAIVITIVARTDHRAAPRRLRPARRPRGRSATPDERRRDPAGEARGLRFALVRPARPRSSVVLLLTVLPGRAAAQPGDRRDLQQLAVHGQPDLHHHDDVPGGRHLLRHRRQDDHEQRRRHQRRSPRRSPGWPAWSSCCCSSASSSPTSTSPTCRPSSAVKMADVLESADIGALLAADRLHPRDRDPRHDHPGRRCRSGRSSPRSSCRCSCASASRRRPCWPPTGSATRRSTSSRR